MSGVLLTHSNHLFSDRKQVEKMQPYPPLQTLIAAALLRERGIPVSLFDPTLVPPDEGFEAAVHRHQPDLIIVCEDDFNFLSKMCLARNRELAFRMADISRGHAVPIFAHGSDASDHVDQYMHAGFDGVIIGEVEATLLELASGEPRAGIAGLAFRAGRQLRFNPPRPLRTNLDELPLPAWDLVDMDRYRSAWLSAHGYFSLNVVSSRGCPYHCNWCAKPIYGNAYHARSPHSVASELRQLKRSFDPDHIWFADDIFALSSRWTLQFADAVETLDARIPFKMQSRCDLMTRETVKALRRSGCAEVWMGAESGSQKILDAMDKGIRVQQIHEACKNLRRHGIRAGLFLQFGYPGEGWAEVEETVRMVREVAPDDVGISVSYPLPGTRFHQIVSNQLGLKANWNESGDLSMMFRGTFGTEFYRALADAIHAEVRGGDAVTAWQRLNELRSCEESRGLRVKVA
jgi:anaerobic magnesium-protoporphyrin IX monomethyl ester cyclase